MWARAQGLEGEPDGINGALLSLLAAHLTASGALVRGVLALLQACAYADLGSPHILSTSLRPHVARLISGFSQLGTPKPVLVCRP